MARLTYILLAALVGFAVAQPQRNLNYPTTKRPATPGGPTPSAPATPAPTTAAPSSTTPKAAPYPAAGFRPGRAFNLPTEEKKAEQPSTSYGPPADKYGPPEESTTTVQPELGESTTETVAANETTAKIPKGLQPGFYFIQLPGGGIQKVSLLTNAAVVEFPAEAAAAVEEKESVERDVENDDDDREPTSTPASVNTVNNPGRTIQVWPPVQVVEVQPAIVDIDNDKIVKPLRSERIVAVEPVLYVQPKSYSYVSQFRTW